MCGRYSTAKIQKKKFEEKLKLKLGDYSPSFNACPGRDHPVISSIENEISLSSMHWGLIPNWTKDSAKSIKPINARSETLSEKPSFRGLLKNNRCLVPADGYYEWENNGPSKVPYYIRSSDTRSMAFAGLCDRWNDNGSGPVSSYSIITKQASQSIRFIHERMPVVLPAHYWKDWLDPDLSADVMNDMIHSSISELSFHPVSKLVNNPDNDTESLITPVQPKTNDTQDEFKF